MKVSYKLMWMAFVIVFVVSRIPILGKTFDNVGGREWSFGYPVE